MYAICCIVLWRIEWLPLATGILTDMSHMTSVEMMVVQQLTSVKNPMGYP